MGAASPFAPLEAGIVWSIERCYFHASKMMGKAVRTTVALDDDLVAQAQSFTGLREKSSLIREALKALIERESARRLARLGGSEGRLKAPPRRRASGA